MNRKRTAVVPFSASITLGTNLGYTEKTFNEKQLIDFIQQYQDNLIEEINVHLSVCLSECKIILSGQAEPHYRLSFINYPKFPLPHEMLRNEIEALAKALMKEFRQNRIVLEFPDETVMLEEKEDVDPRIRT